MNKEQNGFEDQGAANVPPSRFKRTVQAGVVGVGAGAVCYVSARLLGASPNAAHVSSMLGSFVGGVGSNHMLFR